MSCFSGILWESSTYICPYRQHVQKHVDWSGKSMCYYQVQSCDNCIVSEKQLKLSLCLVLQETLHAQNITNEELNLLKTAWVRLINCLYKATVVLRWYVSGPKVMVFFQVKLILNGVCGFHGEAITGRVLSYFPFVISIFKMQFFIFVAFHHW